MVKESTKISNNKEFLKWLNSAIKDGYVPYLNIDEMDNLIEKIVNWYQFKYPNRFFELKHGVRDRRFDKEYTGLNEQMDLDAFRWTLSFDEIATLDCNYREPNMNVNLKSLGYFDKDGNYYEARAWYEYVSLMIVESIHEDVLVSRFIISANAVDGIVEDYSLDKFMAHYKDNYLVRNITLDELYERLKDIESLDLSELEETVKVHKCDVELRNRLLNMAIYRILGAKDTISEFSKERAMKMATEFSEYYGLKLDIENLSLDDKAFNNSAIIRKRVNNKLR